jgi:hypothetical protein
LARQWRAAPAAAECGSPTEFARQNAILDRARKDSNQAGYNAASQEVARFINGSLGKSLDGTSIPSRSADDHPSLKEVSLAALVLNKIETHPDGIFAVEIKDWLQAGNSRYAGQADAGKRVDTTLTRLKSRWGSSSRKTMENGTG